MRTVYELAGLHLLDPRGGNRHIARRTTPVLNGSEGAVPTGAVAPREQPLQQRTGLRLRTEQSLT